MFSKTHIHDLDLNDKHTLYGRDSDPWGYEKGADVYNSQNVSESDIRKAMYETTEDRATGELVNYPGTKLDKANKCAIFHFTPVNTDIENDKEPVDQRNKKIGKWKKGSALIRGYTVVYGKDERDVIALEEKRTHKFLIASDWIGKVDKVEYDSDNTLKVIFNNDFLTDPKNADLLDPSKKGKHIVISAMARCDLEDDFEGDSLGEVELVLTDFDFKPRPTTIGVTWSQMAEITLDASFGVSTQELLVQYAAEAIRVNLDYRAFKLAYLAAKTNNKGHFVKFDAAYNNNTKEGYIHNAQTFPSAIDTLSDNMLNEIKRLSLTV